MDRNSAFFRTSLGVAERFLQTAVVIDDRAFRRQDIPEPVPREIQPPPTLSTIQVPTEELLFESEPSGKEVPEPLQEGPDPDPHGIDAEAVIRSFAERGVVCSVLQRLPDENPAAPGEIAGELLVPSDVLIIDWQVHHQDGSDSSEETLKFLEASLTQSSKSVPEQLRVIIVYTGAQDLLRVAEKIEERLSSTEGRKIEKDGKFAFRLGATRIVVLGKFSRIRSSESNTQQVKSDADLAEWATREFAAMTAGLVSNVALAALAEIRRVTHRILSRFGPELDAPFLAHRALLSPPAEGNDHLIPLIVSELEAVLEERLGDELLSDDKIKEWLDNRPNPQPHLTGMAGAISEAQARQVVRDICMKGVAAHADFAIPSQPGWVKKLADGKGVPDLQTLTTLINATVAAGCNEKLEELMSLKPRYGDKAPLLAMGTLLESLSGDAEVAFWLCLQPSCDCYIRTGGPSRAFPLLRLRAVTEQFNLLANKDGAYVRLRWEPRPHRIRMFEFSANTPSGAVAAFKAGETHCFKSTDQAATFRWIGELKFAQAQRIAQALSSESARVGLTETEWLRRNGR